MTAGAANRTDFGLQLPVFFMVYLPFIGWVFGVLQRRATGLADPPRDIVGSGFVDRMLKELLRCGKFG